MKELIPELLFKILCDTLPSTPADAAYLFAQTAANQNSVLEKGAELYSNGTIRAIWLADSSPKSGYPGFDSGREKLIGLGVPDNVIVGIPTQSYDSLNTYIEAFEAARFAKANSASSLIVVSAPFHQLRAFATIVTTLSREYPELKAYSQPGNSLDWHDRVAHSQGELEGTREEFIHTEIERISKYHEKGDLVSLEQVKEYLRNRHLFM